MTDSKDGKLLLFKPRPDLNHADVDWELVDEERNRELEVLADQEIAMLDDLRWRFIDNER